MATHISSYLLKIACIECGGSLKRTDKFKWRCKECGRPLGLQSYGIRVAVATHVIDKREVELQADEYLSAIYAWLTSMEITGDNDAA